MEGLFSCLRCLLAREGWAEWAEMGKEKGHQVTDNENSGETRAKAHTHTLLGHTYALTHHEKHTRLHTTTNTRTMHPEGQ